MLPTRFCMDAHTQFKCEEFVARATPMPKVTVSAGTSVANEAKGPGYWLGSADAALYRAKKSGRNYAFG